MIHKSDRVVITGCGGMLGEAVYEVFKDVCQVRASDIDLNVPWLERLDVSVSKDVEVYLAKVKPNYIIHLAALTDMEYCELHPEEAYSTNTGGAQNVAEYARDHNIPLVYISTAGIFDGGKDEYTESDTPNPLSVYSKSKYGGELVARTLPKSVVIRAGWMMGAGPKKDKKFINKIIKQLRVGAKEIAVVNDKFGTPCHTYDLAQSIKYLLDHDAYGLYHGACDGGGSRADIARFLLECFGLTEQVKVKEVDSSFFAESYFAKRPRSEKLINTELKKIAPHLTRDWKICLKEYIERFNWNLWDLNTSGMERSFYKNYFKVEKEHWLMVVRRMIVKDNLKLCLDKNPAETKVLDFGCGSGIFVDELAKQGYQAYGLDISEEAVKFGMLQGVKNLGAIDAHKINFPDNTFDAVFTLDVLEHLEDEKWALDEIRRVLKPGGVAIIMVPAYMFLWGVQDEVAHHYRRYTKSSLLKKIKEATSLKTLKASYFNTFLFPPIAFFRIVSRIFGIKGRESDFDINSPLMNRFFFSIFNTERKILKHVRFPFGVSILLVLKKETDSSS
ncbi:MAG: sugar nucleotide-binding protein [Patescibacteria group bacterium]